MLHLALLGLILWILYLFWRINTKSLMMPVKEDKTSDGFPPSAKVSSTAQSPPPVEHSPSTVPCTSEQREGPGPQTGTTSGDLEVKTVDTEALQVPSAARTSNRHMGSSGPEMRERLKFILGASEDNSSDDEPMADKPPSGAPQPLTNTRPPQQTTCTQAQSRSSTIK